MANISLSSGRYYPAVNSEISSKCSLRNAASLWYIGNRLTLSLQSEGIIKETSAKLASILYLKIRGKCTPFYLRLVGAPQPLF